MKKLLLSTAMLCGLGGIAMAQDAIAPGTFRAQADPTNLRASEFIGMRVYASEAAIDATEYDGMQQDWADIGEVNDIILSRDKFGRVCGTVTQQIAFGIACQAVCKNRWIRSNMVDRGIGKASERH